MPQHLAPEQAAAQVRPVDALGLPLGPGQPPAFLKALGQRDDWVDLRVSGALLVVGTELFTRPGVNYLSGFFGPFERALRDADANISFAPADFRRFAPLLERANQRVMATVAAPPDENGWCSLSLHAGGTITEMRRAGADPNRLLVVEVSPRFPRTHGLPPEHLHALHVDEIDILVESERRRSRCPTPSPARSTRRSRSTPGGSSRTARPCRPASAPYRRRSRPGSRTTRAGATASTPRCSPTA